MRKRAILFTLLGWLALSSASSGQPQCLPNSHWWDQFRVNAYYRNTYGVEMRVMGVVYSERWQSWLYVGEYLNYEWSTDPAHTFTFFAADQPIGAWCEVQP